VRAALGRNVLVNMGTVAASLATSLITLPFILGKVGTDGYGTWIIGFTFVTYLMIADNGFGPAIQRWVGVAHGGGETEAARRVLWSALTGYTAIGLVAGALVALGAHWWVDVFLDDGSPQRTEALHMFRLVGLALLATLWATGMQNVLQGLGRFPAIAASSMLGSVAYLAGVFVLLGPADLGLEGLGLALVAQQATVAVTRFAFVAGLAFSGRPGLLARDDARQIVSFASKLQLNAFAALFNSQSDKVVVGVVSNARLTGELGIASQLVDAGRLVALAALTPVFSALALTVGTDDRPLLRRQFEWMHRTWIYAIGGGTLIALAALQPLLGSWLGHAHDDAVGFGLILVAANGFNLLNGVPLAYLRAVGQPGLEARLGPFVALMNLVLSIALGVAFGAYGVVTATLVTYLIGTAWSLRRFHAMAPEVQGVAVGELVRPVLLAVVAAALALGAGLAVDAALPTGIGLAGVLVTTGLAYLGYLSAVTGNPLTPAGIRTLAEGMRGA
jgi:O-antigen/teichoic acid export membrane protein